MFFFVIFSAILMMAVSESFAGTPDILSEEDARAIIRFLRVKRTGYSFCDNEIIQVFPFESLGLLAEGRCRFLLQQLHPRLVLEPGERLPETCVTVQFCSPKEEIFCSGDVLVVNAYGQDTQYLAFLNNHVSQSILAMASSLIFCFESSSSSLAAALLLALYQHKGVDVTPDSLLESDLSERRQITFCSEDLLYTLLTMAI